MEPQKTKKKKLDHEESKLIASLQNELEASKSEKPCELQNLLAPQGWQKKSGNLLKISNDPIDTLQLHLKQLVGERKESSATHWHTPYISRMIAEDLCEEKFQQRLGRKFMVENRLFNKITLERVALNKSLSKYSEKEGKLLSSKQELKYKNIDLLSLLETYVDVCNEYGNTQEAQMSSKAIIFHLCNHILKREALIKENDLIYREIVGAPTNPKQIDLKDFSDYSGDEEKKQMPSSESSASEKEEAPEIKFDLANNYTPTTSEGSKDELIKDQGFMKPKILILAPLKCHAYEIVCEIVQMFRHKWKGVGKKKKFKEEYGTEEEVDNDCFRLGITFFGSQMKLYSQFRKSDLIIASPVGLRTIIEGEEAKKLDFLSSIEVLYLHEAHQFIYQNIEHLEEIVRNINETPTSTEGLTDINRIMDIFLDGKARFLRQTIINAKFVPLDLLYIFKSCTSNYLGRITIPRFYSTCLTKSLVKDKVITLRRIPVGDLESSHEKKMEYFFKHLWPMIYSLGPYTLLYVASYFDFVMLKKKLREMEASCGFISEYSNKKMCQRERAFFETQKTKILLYTERAQNFSPINLRYAHNLVFYSLPQDIEKFTRLLPLLEADIKIITKISTTQKRAEPDSFSPEAAQKNNVHIFYTKHEACELEKLVGTAHLHRYLNAESKITLT